MFQVNLPLQRIYAAMLVNFLVTLTVLLLFSGLALEGGMLQLRKLQLQHAADAAALGAIYERARGNSDWVATGRTDAALNGFTNGTNGVSITIQSPPVGGSFAGDSTAIQAIVSQTYHLTFMSMVGGASATPTSGAVARPTVTPNCYFLMGSGSSYYPLLNTGSGYISANCNIYVNSTTRSIEDDAGSPLVVPSPDSILLAGSPSTASYTNLGQTPAATLHYYVTAKSDPLASLTAPASPTSLSQCTFRGYAASSSTTLSPGTYCGGMNLLGGTITLNPGLYIVTGGMIWSGATVQGTGVTIYLTSGPSPTYSNGTFTIFRTGVYLSAPTSTINGGYTGVLVFADRNWSTDGSQGLQIIASYIVSDGIWYALNTGIYNYASTLTATNYLGIVTNNISNSNGTLIAPSPNYSSLSGGSPLTTTTVESIVQ
jgi:hypothetical protein